jgi:hypothetical protein
MPGLRKLLPMVPFLVGALAAGVWLWRREAGRRALSAGPAVPQIEPAPATGVAPIGPEAAEERPEIEAARRFEREPIDIVTVVDDLLRAGR